MRFFRRRQGRSESFHGRNKSVSQLGLLVLGLAYWLFAWQLERVDYSLSPPWLWQQVLNAYPLFDLLTPYVLLPAEFLAPRVLRHFLPLAAGWWLARRATTGFLQSFYDLADLKEAEAMLGRLQVSAAAKIRSVRIRRSEFEEDRKKQPVLRIGGPGRISVGLGDAVVTEHNGRTKNVFGPGTHKLGLFEHPRAVVDVRPQERETSEAALVTSDGIEVKAEVSVTFQVNSAGQEPSREDRFPFDEGAVRRVAYAQSNLGEDKVSTWDGLALSITTGQLSNIAAEYPLDELIFSNYSGVNAHRQLKTEMERRAKSALANFGIEVRGTRLGRMELPEQITEQRIKYWQAYWEGQRRIHQADGTAAALGGIESARAEGEAIMIQAIAEAMNSVRLQGRPELNRQVLALRLIETLEKMAQQSLEIAPETDDVVSQLADVRNQLLLSNRPVDDEN